MRAVNKYLPAKGKYLHSDSLVTVAGDCSACLSRSRTVIKVGISLEEIRDVRQAILNVGMVFCSELRYIKVNSSVFVSLVTCVRCVWV